MARQRVGLVSTVVLGLASAATTGAAILSWRGFTASSSFLTPLAAIGLVVALVGAMARWQRLAAPIVVLAQAIAGLVATHAAITGSWVPDGRFKPAIRAAFDSAQEFASPVPETRDISVHALILVGGLAAFLLVDALGVTLRRVSVAGLPLLAIYSVPVSLLDGALSWQVFALTALGFLLMLYLQEQLHADRWGRALDDSSDELASSTLSATAGRRTAVRISALAIAVSTVAVAVALPPIIPTLKLQVFNNGNGTGNDNSEITIKNPLVDLRRDLRRGPNFELVRFITDDPDPAYLRISVLNRFTDNEWSSGNRDVPSDQQADGSPLPPLQGVTANVRHKEYRYDVEMTDQFKSTWLPTQAPVSSVKAAGDWRFDTSTRDFISSESGLTTAGRDYSMVGVALDYDTADLIDAPLARNEVSEEVRAVPATVPTSVLDLARQVTADASSPFQKAVALQQWFRQDGGFTYSLKRSPEGNSVDDLVKFLDKADGRVGYCEQFAASMAVMARTVGVPSRVAVGFLKPEQTGRTSFVYRAHDLHAWPELYFPGSGWVRFDPTPGARVGSPPSYTDTDVTVGNPDSQPTRQPTDAATARPGGDRPSAAPSPKPLDEPTPTSTTSNTSDGSFPWVGLLIAFLVVALLLALALLPRTLRDRRRKRRLNRGAEAAWEELRAVMIDLGHPWPERRSPRETQSVIEQLLGRPDDPQPEPRPRRGPAQCPSAVAALRRIVVALERGWYAPSHDSANGEFADDIVEVSVALEAGVQPRVRTRALWWPRSVLRREPGFNDVDINKTDELERV